MTLLELQVLYLPVRRLKTKQYFKYSTRIQYRYDDDDDDDDLSVQNTAQINYKALLYGNIEYSI